MALFFMCPGFHSVGLRCVATETVLFCQLRWTLLFSMVLSEKLLFLILRLLQEFFGHSLMYTDKVKTK